MEGNSYLADLLRREMPAQGPVHPAGNGRQNRAAIFQGDLCEHQAPFTIILRLVLRPVLKWRNVSWQFSIVLSRGKMKHAGERFKAVYLFALWGAGADAGGPYR